MFEKALNYILLHNLRTKRTGEQFLKCLESEFAEEFLELLLKLMRLVFFVNKDFRRNIEGFNGRYLFKSRNKNITVAVIFQNKKMDIYENEIDKANVTVTFKNAKALMSYLLSPKPDILGSILRQDVTIDGNLNYLYKFAYMATHLRLMVTGQA